MPTQNFWDEGAKITFLMKLLTQQQNIIQYLQFNELRQVMQKYENISFMCVYKTNQFSALLRNFIPHDHSVSFMNCTFSVS